MAVGFDPLDKFWRTVMRKNLMELIGTFFLVTTIGFSGEPLAIGLMLTVMVYCGAHISGAHYNPAVTLALYFRNNISINTAVSYWISQILGATLAGIFHYVTFTESFAPSPADNVSFTLAIFIEALATAALALVVLNVVFAPKLKGNYIYGLAIGLTVTALAYSFGDLSGGAFNPAVAIGPMLVDYATGGSYVNNMCLYLVGPFLGGFIASTVYGYTNSSETNSNE